MPETIRTPELPDSNHEPAPDAWAARGLTCMACRRGDHPHCERPARRMPSWPLVAVCECEHPSHQAPMRIGAR